LRLRTEKTDAMFGPIQETISLLKKFNINVKDSTLKQLEDLTIEWSKLKIL
jgi:hypothetical protein